MGNPSALLTESWEEDRKEKHGKKTGVRLFLDLPCNPTMKMGSPRSTLHLKKNTILLTIENSSAL